MYNGTSTMIEGSEAGYCRHGNHAVNTCEKCEKETAAEKKEVEKIATSLRYFAVDTLPFLDSNKLIALESKEIIPLLQRYWNTPASFEHFRDLLLEFGELPRDVKIEDIDAEMLMGGGPLGDLYLDYLLNKMPMTIQINLRADLEKAADAEGRRSILKKALKITSAGDTGLGLGFHTSPASLSELDPDPDRPETLAPRWIKPVNTRDTFVDPETNQTRQDDSAKVYFSNDGKKLYMNSDKAGKAFPRFLYIIEMSRHDVKSPGFYAPGVGAFYVKRSVLARHKISLMPDGKESTGKKILEALGLSLCDFRAGA